MRWGLFLGRLTDAGIPMVLKQHFAALREFLGCLVLTVGLSAYVLAMARITGGPSALWLANGASIGWLIRRPLRDAWHILLSFFLGYLIARLGVGDPIISSGLRALCNVAEILVISATIRHYFPTITNATSVSRVAIAAIASAVVGCAISALAISIVDTLHSQSPMQWKAFSAHFRSHFLGMVIAGTASFFVLVKGWHIFGPRKGRDKLLLNLLLLIATTCVVFVQSRYPLLFLIYPTLLLLIFRYRFSGMILGIAVIAIVTTIATAFKIGPFDLVVDASADLRVLMAQIFIGTCCLVAVPVALALVEQKRLQRQVFESELRYRMLAENSGDLVMRIQANGDRRYVSPSIKELLGWDVSEFLSPRPELIHPDDRNRIEAVVKALRISGGTTTATYRLQHRDGHYVWLEAFARLVESPNEDEAPDIIYSGRDVTQRVLAEESLVESRTQLRTISDNVPAIIARIDLTETYTYINRFVEQVSGDRQSDMIGRTVREVRGPVLYEKFRVPLARALAGESVYLEYEATYGGQLVHFQAHYVPDRDSGGKVCGVFALTTDITHSKNVERELFQLAHYDSLTGLANRRYFNDRAPVLIDAAHQNNGDLLLVLLDIDHFKAINDTWGHAAGDAVLAEVGLSLQRLSSETCLVARLGGDEFVVLCNNPLNEAEADAFVRSLWSELHLAVLSEGICIDVNVSIGAVQCVGEQSRTLLMKWADEALYEAKYSGRNTYRIIFKANSGGPLRTL